VEVRRLTVIVAPGDAVVGRIGRCIRDRGAARSKQNKADKQCRIHFGDFHRFASGDCGDCPIAEQLQPICSR
jgi:hypothetical protein